MFPFLQTNITSDTSYWAKTHNARLPERPTKKHVELVANSETGNTGLKKGSGLHALCGLCATVRCAPLEIIVPWQCPGRKKFLAPPLAPSLRYHYRPVGSSSLALRLGPVGNTVYRPVKVSYDHWAAVKMDPHHQYSSSTHSDQRLVFQPDTSHP